MRNNKNLILLIMLFFVFVLLPFNVAADNTITLWDIQVPAEPEHEIIQNAIDRFESDHDYVIDWVPIVNDDYKTRINVAISADDIPDIFMTWGGGDLLFYINEGLVYEITDYLAEDNWSDRFMDTALDLTTFNSSTYGVPFTDVAPVVVFYREDIFEQYGLSEPQTYDELLEVSETLIENGITPFALANSGRWPGSFYYMYLVDRLGGPEAYRAAVDPEVEGSFTDDPFIEAGEKLMELVEMGAFPNEFNSLSEDQGHSRTMLYTQDAAMYLMGMWGLAEIRHEDPTTHENMNFFNFPEIEGAAGSATGLIGSVGQNFYSVTQASENKEGAVEFLKYLTDEKSKEQLLEAGTIPPFAGIEEYLDDPLRQRIMEMVNTAESVQLYYDQDLPPELAQIHLDSLQGMLEGDITPQEKAQKMADAIEEYYE